MGLIRRGVSVAGVAAAAAASPGVPPALGAEPVAADAAATPGIALDYRAAAGCPRREEFVELLRSRTREHGGAAPRIGKLAVALVVEWRSGGRTFVGRLEIEDRRGERSVRQIEAPACGEAAAALALVAALAVVADSGEPERPRPSEPGEPPGAAPGQPVVGSFGPTQSAASRRARAQQLGAAEAPDEDVRYGPLGAMGPPARRGWWALGIHLDANAGVLPSPALGPRLFVDARLDRSSGWTPSARLSAARISSPAADPARGALVWTAGRIDVCPSGFDLGETSLLWPCALFEAGALREDHAAGTSPPEEAGPRLWLSAGAIGRLQWILFDVLLLEFEAGGAVPFERDEFFAGTTARHRPGVIAAWASLGVGARFP